jgi:hypothetical protein
MKGALRHSGGMIRFGILDSGPAAQPDGEAALARRFVVGADGTVGPATTLPDLVGHGTTLASLILAAAPAVRLVTAQVFVGRGIAAPAVIAAGLDWLVAEGVRVVNMSFGLHQDRRVLAAACGRAVEAGVLLVASAPAMGPPVFPASYPGVIAVTGDARCQGDEISHLAEGRAAFGAAPRLTDGRQLAGASVAAAKVSAKLAELLCRCPTLDAGGALQRLQATAVPLGPQREHSAAVSRGLSGRTEVGAP